MGWSDRSGSILLVVHTFYGKTRGRNIRFISARAPSRTEKSR